jgi:hypothetical protein
VPEEIGIEIATALRGKAPPARSVPLPAPLATKDNDPPPFALRWPELLSAAARNAFKDAAQRTIVMVDLPPPSPPAPPLHPLVEPSRYRRQHRRLTWTERAARYAAPLDAVVQVVTPCEPLARWLRDLQPKSIGATPGS